MTISQFFFILKARFKVICITLMVVVLATLVVNLVLAKKYTATSTVIVNYKAADPVTGLAMPAQLTPGYMATQVEIISSKKVALKVIDDLRLADAEAVKKNFQDATKGKGDIKDWLSDILLKSIDIKPSRESSIIDISFKGSNPEFAAAIANSFAEAYLQTTIELKVEPSRKAAIYFNQQVKSYKDDLRATQEALSKYQQENGIVSVDSRVDVENARLNDLSSQLVAAQAALTEAQSRQRNSSGSKAFDSPDIAANPLIQGLKSQLATAEGKFADISERLDKNHPQYQGAKAEIENLKNELSRQIQAASTSVASNSRILQQQEADIRAALSEQKEKVLEINRTRDNLSILTREVDNSQQAYDTAMQRFTANNIEGQSNQSDVVILNPAIPPIEASNPRVFLNMLIAIFFGSFLGVSVALAMEMMDRRVRTPEDIFFISNAPVLGVIEKANKHTKRFKFPKFRMAGKVA